MIGRFAFLIALASTAASAVAAQIPNAVSIDSAVMVERNQTDAQGHNQTVLEEPKVVIPGDRLLFTLSYRNNGDAPATNFVVTNPVPGAVAFDSTSDGIASVSVDGGATWGQLADLTIQNPDGTTRPARADDVTHVRWVFAQPIPAHDAGRLMFRGIVR